MRIDCLDPRKLALNKRIEQIFHVIVIQTFVTQTNFFTIEVFDDILEDNNTNLTSQIITNSRAKLDRKNQINTNAQEV